ncbi:MAG: dihydrodipicolinate synthase family protein [Candidatus Limnocylindrales bacterium]
MVFEGVRPVLHLPFADTPAQPILEDELARLAEHMLDLGVDGLAVPQLASEAWTLTDAERERVVSVAAEVCAGRAPLVVGLDGTTAVAVDRARRAAAAGAAGLMVLPPRQATNPEQLVEHYAAVAAASGLPVMVQDSPQVTGVRLDVATVVRMREASPLVLAVKSEIPGAGTKASAIHEAGLELIAGWGGLHYLEQLDRGAVGCFPGCDLGPAIKAIDTAARGGRAGEAQALYRRILPFLSLATASLDLLLLTAKRHLRRSGIFSTEVLRAPARTLDAREAQVVDALLDELAAAGVPGF